MQRQENRVGVGVGVGVGTGAAEGVSEQWQERGERARHAPPRKGDRCGRPCLRAPSFLGAGREPWNERTNPSPPKSAKWPKRWPPGSQVLERIARDTARRRRGSGRVRPHIHPPAPRQLAWPLAHRTGSDDRTLRRLCVNGDQARVSLLCREAENELGAPIAQSANADAPRVVLRTSRALVPQVFRAFPSCVHKANEWSHVRIAHRAQC